MASFHKSTIELKAPYNQVYNLALNAVNNYFKVIKEDRRNGEILATAGFSLSSMGENILIIVQSNQNDTSCSVTIASESQISTTLIDWGKNKNNTRKITDYIQYYFPILKTDGNNK